MSVGASGSMPERRAQRLGLWLAVGAAVGFSFKAIFVKLAYAVPQPLPLDALSLLALRMCLAAPVFLWVALHSGAGAAPLTRRDALTLAALGSLGYYGASTHVVAGMDK